MAICAVTKYPSAIFKLESHLQEDKNSENGNTEHYTGLTKNSFKERYHGHMESFRKRKKTTSSTH